MMEPSVNEWSKKDHPLGCARGCIFGCASMCVMVIVFGIAYLLRGWPQ